MAGERYVVDDRRLHGLVKTSDVSIETFPIGTLKSVNVRADDKSDPVIKGVVKTATTLDSWSVGAPGVALSPAQATAPAGGQTAPSAIIARTSSPLTIRRACPMAIADSARR